LKGSFNTQINKLGTEVDIILGGYTGSVQVLDNRVNTFFKGDPREEFEAWMCTNGFRRQPSKIEVSQWAARDWAQVTTATIVNTWKNIGHKVAAYDVYEGDIIPANKPGAGEENTTDEED
jgi:hypothetical protein